MPEPPEVLAWGALASPGNPFPPTPILGQGTSAFNRVLCPQKCSYGFSIIQPGVLTCHKQWVLLGHGVAFCSNAGLRSFFNQSIVCVPFST